MAEEKPPEKPSGREDEQPRGMGRSTRPGPLPHQLSPAEIDRIHREHVERTIGLSPPGQKVVERWEKLASDSSLAAPGKTVRESIKEAIKQIRDSDSSGAPPASPPPPGDEPPPKPSGKNSGFMEAADKAVIAICELLGLLFGLPFGDDLYRNTPITSQHLSYLAVGVAFAGGGVMWPWARTQKWMPEVFSASIRKAASDARIWIMLIVAIFFYGIAPEMFRRAAQPIQRSEATKPLTQAPAKTREPEKKIIIEATPLYLMKLYSHGMSSEGDRLLQPYIGKWIRVNQTVSDVRFNGVWTYIKEPNRQDQRTVVLLFDPKWQDRLNVLTRGQEIKALCQIVGFGVTITGITLTNCEFE